MKYIKVLISVLLISLSIPSFPVSQITQTITLKTKDLDEFVDTSSCLMNKKGEFFVFAPRSAKIFKFRTNGTFDKSFCRRGEGPGEIIRVFYIYYNPADDCLYLPEFYSQGRGKVTIYDCDGNFKGLMKVGISLKHMDMIQEILFLKDGSFYLTTSERVDWKPEGKLFVTHEELVAKYFKPAGELATDIHKGLFPRELTDRIGRGGPSILFAPRYSLAVTADDSLAFIRNDDNTVKIFTKAGKLVKTIHIAIEKEIISDVEFNTKKDEYVNYFTSRNDAWMASLAKQMIKLECKPFFTSFFITRKYIVLASALDKDHVHAAHKVKFFDLNGRYLGQKIITGLLMKFTDDYIIVFSYGADESETYRIEPNTFSF